MLEDDKRASRTRRLSLIVVAVGMLAAIAGQTRPSALAGQAAAGRQAASPRQSVVYSSVPVCAHDLGPGRRRRHAHEAGQR